MPLLFNSFAVLILVMGGLAPSLSHVIPAQSLAFILIAIAIVIGVGLGFWWFRCLRKISITTSSPFNPDDVIDDFLNNHLFWLQKARPKRESLVLERDKARSLMRVIRCRFLNSQLFFLNLVPSLIVFILLTDHTPSKRLIGRLLESNLGKPIVLAACLYFVISITSAYSLGLFAKLGGGEK